MKAQSKAAKKAQAKKRRKERKAQAAAEAARRPRRRGRRGCECSHDAATMRYSASRLRRQKRTRLRILRQAARRQARQALVDAAIALQCLVRRWLAIRARERLRAASTLAAAEPHAAAGRGALPHHTRRDGRPCCRIGWALVRALGDCQGLARGNTSSPITGEQLELGRCSRRITPCGRCATSISDRGLRRRDVM